MNYPYNQHIMYKLFAEMVGRYHYNACDLVGSQGYVTKVFLSIYIREGYHLLKILLYHLIKIFFCR